MVRGRGFNASTKIIDECHRYTLLIGLYQVTEVRSDCLQLIVQKVLFHLDTTPYSCQRRDLFNGSVGVGVRIMS